MADVWIGLAHARPADPEADHQGAYVQVAARADDSAAFTTRVVEALGEQGYDLVELEDAQPVVDAMERHELGADLLEAAVRAGRGAVEFDVFRLYESDDDDGERDAVPPDAGAVLEAAASERAFVSVRSKPSADARWDGFVVGLSREWVLLHVVDDGIELDGYRAVRRRDVVSAARRDRAFAARALALRGQGAEPLPDLALVDARALLTSAQQHFPLLSVELSRLAPGACYIGCIRAIDDENVAVLTIDLDAEWDEVMTYRLDDVTAIGFGGRYEEALWLVGGEPPPD
jgi:hypothetical protein